MLCLHIKSFKVDIANICRGPDTFKRKKSLATGSKPSPFIYLNPSLPSGLSNVFSCEAAHVPPTENQLGFFPCCQNRVLLSPFDIDFTLVSAVFGFSLDKVRARLCSS